MPPRVAPPLHQDDVPNDAGFTVLEALVSFVLFAIVGGTSMLAVVNTTQSRNTTQDRVTAANLAQQDVQAARSLRFPNYPQAVAAHNVVVGDQTYSVTRAIDSACPVSSDPNNPAVAWTPGQATSMQLTTTVTWRDATRPVAVATEIAC